MVITLIAFAGVIVALGFLFSALCIGESRIDYPVWYQLSPAVVAALLLVPISLTLAAVVFCLSAGANIAVYLYVRRWMINAAGEPPQEHSTYQEWFSLSK